MGELLLTLRRHNARPNHLHVVIEAPGFHKLTTALYPEGDPYLSSDFVLGVKKSLVVVSMQCTTQESLVIPRACPRQLSSPFSFCSSCFDKPTCPFP